MKIAIGSDDAGYPLKKIIIDLLGELEIEHKDFGVKDEQDATLYPNVAEVVALSVKNKDADRGILICGTGLGMSIVANKIPGIRAAVCHDVYSAERAMKSNNAQVLTMGARVIGSELAKTIVTAWLNSEFTGGRSAPKVELIDEIDKKYNGQ